MIILIVENVLVALNQLVFAGKAHNEVSVFSPFSGFFVREGQIFGTG